MEQVEHEVLPAKMTSVAEMAAGTTAVGRHHPVHRLLLFIIAPLTTATVHNHIHHSVAANLFLFHILLTARAVVLVLDADHHHHHHRIHTTTAVATTIIIVTAVVIVEAIVVPGAVAWIEIVAA